jgi:hypothetical protein
MRIGRAMLILGVVSWPLAGWAQSPLPGGMPPPSGMSLARSAAMRFPQPVRVGDLAGRTVLQPVESQVVLGTVERLVRLPDGEVDAVMRLGGLLGFGGRPIAVPIDAMVLLGRDMEVVAYTPAALRRFATFVDGTGVTVPADSVVRIGLAKPSH